MLKIFTLLCFGGSLEKIPTQDLSCLSRSYCLSIDGGGVRGIFPAAVLYKMETLSHKKTHELFRGGITGTSTGSLIALGLATRKSTDKNDKNYEQPLFTACEIVKFYEEHAANIFSWKTQLKPAGMKERWWEKFKITPILGNFFYTNGYGFFGPKYSNSYLRGQLEEKFGDKTLSDVLVPVQVVTFDIDGNGGPRYFNSHENPKMKIVDVLLAATAAPTFFHPVSINESSPNGDTLSRNYTCIDGGIYENNPVFASMGFLNYNLRFFGLEPKRLYESCRILSIGTGETQLSDTTPWIVRKFLPYGLLHWAPLVVDFGIYGTSTMADLNMKRIFGINNYNRIQATIDKDFSQMDNHAVMFPLKKMAEKEHTQIDFGIKNFLDSINMDHKDFQTSQKTNFFKKIKESFCSLF